MQKSPAKESSVMDGSYDGMDETMGQEDLDMMAEVSKDLLNS